MVCGMWGKLATGTVLTAAIAACSSTGTPATTPTAAPTTNTTVTTVRPTTTTAATTTTADRLAEIEALFQDLEERRLQALYDGDREAFRALFANDEYMERSMVLFDLVEFVGDWSVPEITVSDLLSDGEECLAAVVESDYSRTTVGGDESSGTEVLELGVHGWGFSYAGEGWACDGPHPLSS
jgi:hypothetical protein